MSIYIPFLILIIYSLALSVKIKIDIYKSILIVSSFIIFVIYFFGKVGFLPEANLIIISLSVVILVYLIYQKNFSQKNLVNLFILFIIYSIIIWHSKDLFLYKFDDFTEYGITSKLIYHENILPIYIDYLDKGSHSKINALSYLHYFFLKNSYNDFNETTLLIAHNFFKVLLMINIINYLNINNIKKILLSILIYFLIFILGPGFDRLYVDSTVALIITNLLIIFLFRKSSKEDYYLFSLLLILLPSIKYSAFLISFSLMGIFIIHSIFFKKYKKIILVCSVVTISVLMNITHFQNFNFKKNDTELKILEERKQFTSLNFDIKPNPDEWKENKISNNIDRLKAVLLNYLKVSSIEGIYHAKTFLIYNKILDQTNIQFKLIGIPINLWFWIAFILIIAILISKKKNSNFIVPISLLYIAFIFFYFLILVMWGIKNNLINENLTIELSWHRHLGAIIFGIVLFLIIKFIDTYRINYKYYFLLILFFFSISPANSLRPLLPSNIILKENYWNNALEMRYELNELSSKINQIVPPYSKILVYESENFKGYFYPVMNYELIKMDFYKLDGHGLKDFLLKTSGKNLENKIYLLSDVNKIKKINKLKFLNYKNIEGKELLKFKNYILYKIQ